MEDRNPFAFPCPSQIGQNPESLGMTLRDWFAGQALAAAVRAFSPWSAGKACNEVARECYLMADAMLSERERRPS